MELINLKAIPIAYERNVYHLNKKELNVIHIIRTPGLGGVQTYLLDLSNYEKK